MLQKTVYLLVIFMICTQHMVYCQTRISIPAYTGYAIPAEGTDENDNSRLFSEKEGLHNWTDTRQQIQFYFKARSKGSIQLSFLIKNNNAGNTILVSLAGKKSVVNVPQSANFKSVKTGSFNIPDTGFYTITVSSVSKKGKTIADIKSLELSGSAVNNIHFNGQPRRNAASVHLFYPLPDSLKVLSFYNEIMIPKDADILHSYYMACGFARGYFGIQVNGPTERRVIFSVWDAGNETIDRNKVAEENKVQLIAKGEDVFADDFGNEGTGGHSHWVFNWKAEETYKFNVTATIDSAAGTTTYTGYFFDPATQKWKLIACFKAPKDGKPLRKLYSFSENFWGTNGQLLRKAYFSNQWIRRDNGEWKEITMSTFSYDATGKAGDRIDYGAGVENNWFYLWNGGFKEANAKLNDELNRTATGERPVIDLYANADSLPEAIRENEIILTMVREGKLDTTGSKNGVYYKIFEQGSGNYVTINDTVVVNYKGQLLNGSVFDETKEKPAVFPLKRLIRGWQAGIPFCRVGGKIRLIIPSSQAYTIRNLGQIPPNSILIFDVEVVEVRR